MKVFSLYPGVSYAGGVILIAANNLEEAKELAIKDRDVERDGDFANMEEVEELSANVDTPKIIIDKWYMEFMI